MRDMKRVPTLQKGTSTGGRSREIGRDKKKTDLGTRITFKRVKNLRLLAEVDRWRAK